MHTSHTHFQAYSWDISYTVLEEITLYLKGILQLVSWGMGSLLVENICMLRNV